LTPYSGFYDATVFGWCTEAVGHESQLGNNSIKQIYIDGFIPA
jgi:hypothetical protein